MPKISIILLPPIRPFCHDHKILLLDDGIPDSLIGENDIPQQLIPSAFMKRIEGKVRGKWNRRRKDQ